MDMGAIIKNYGNTNAAVMAVKAGADQLLQPLPQDVAPMIDAVTAAVQKGEIPESRINDAVRKILETKAKLGLDKQKFVDLNSVSKTVGNPANQARAQEAADRSITLVRNRNNVLPLNTSSKVVSVTYYDEYNPFQARAFQSTLATGIKNLRAIALDQNADSTTLARVATAIAEADVVLFTPFLVVRASKGQLAIPERITRLFTQTTKPVVLTSLGSPYVLSVFPDIATYVVGWGSSDVSQRAAARALLGQIPIHGRLPIAIPPFHKIGEGIDLEAH
jgi:beta-N-acetylhexosaminidase